MTGKYPQSGQWAECNACGCYNGADATSAATAARASAYVAANMPVRYLCSGPHTLDSPCLPQRGSLRRFARSNPILPSQPSVRIVWLGYEAGEHVRTGAILETCAAESNPW